MATTLVAKKRYKFVRCDPLWEILMGNSYGLKIQSVLKASLVLLFTPRHAKWRNFQFKVLL